MRGYTIEMRIALLLLLSPGLAAAGQASAPVPILTELRALLYPEKPVLAEGRLFARDAAVLEGVKRSLVVGAIEGKHVQHDEVWDVKLHVTPRAENAAIMAPSYDKRQSKEPLLPYTVSTRARVFLRPSTDGRTMLGGVALHDYGYGDLGVIFDGQVRLEPIRKIRLRKEGVEGLTMDGVLTSGIMTNPEDYAADPKPKK
jgi:hypothetical protein